MQTFLCDSCGQLLFFENYHCIKCDSFLGFSVDDGAILTLSQIEGTDLFREISELPDAVEYRYCDNRRKHDACNWLVPNDSEHRHCVSCRLTEELPPLQDETRRKSWVKVEAAKRRLLYSLLRLGLPIHGPSEEQKLGLAFRFQESTPEHPVMTGHASGVITLNMAEANAAFRENAKEKLGEAYRTVLGHLRHECGHYYWDLLVYPSKEWLPQVRELFGDERASYEDALDRHYKKGPPEDWRDHFISSYATMHPWEDWAETWAHYLHMVSTLETAESYQVVVTSPQVLRHRGKPKRARRHKDEFDKLFHDWYSLTFALNGLSRSMGLPDTYPFTISDVVKKKLRMVHEIVTDLGDPSPAYLSE